MKEDLPKPWRSVKLGELCTLVRGASPRPKGDPRYFGGPIPWISIADLSREDGKYLTRTKEGVTAAGAKLSRLLGKGTLIVSNSATICVPKILGVAGCIHDGFVGLTKLSSEADVHYLFHFFNAIRAEVRAKNTQGVTQVNLNTAIFKDMDVPLPPLPEQRRIAELLDQTEELRTRRRAALAHLDGLAQAMFAERFGDPIKNPNGFPTRPMIDLVDSQRPISYGILMPGPDQANGVKYVRVVDMKSGGIDPSEIRRTTEEISAEFRRSLLKAGDLLMSIRGHVGRLAVVPPELDGANITQDTARLAIRGASTIFVREALRTESFQCWMAKRTKGVAVRGINLADVKLMPIIVPPLKEQESFARRVAVIEKLKTSHRTSLAELDALFASLQHRAFRGEL